MRNYQRKQMQTSGLTPTQREWQRAREAEDEFKRRFSAQEIASMSMSEFAALSGRAWQPAPPVPGSVPPRAPEHAPEPVSGPASEPVPQARGISVSEMSPEQYAAARGQLGMGHAREYGVGILNQVPQDYLAGVRKHAGRTALSTSNVTPPPRIERYTIQDDQRLDTRSARDRFSTPGNSWQG